MKRAPKVVPRSNFVTLPTAQEACLRLDNNDRIAITVVFVLVVTRTELLVTARPEVIVDVAALLDPQGPGESVREDPADVSDAGRLQEEAEVEDRLHQTQLSEVEGVEGGHDLGGQLGQDDHDNG